MSKKTKKQSRATRWSEAASKAETAIGELIDLQQEYQEWLDNLPENLQNSALGEKLNAVCDLQLEDAHSTIDEAGAIELPQGFGRD